MISYVKLHDKEANIAIIVIMIIIITQLFDPNDASSDVLAF